MTRAIQVVKTVFVYLLQRVFVTRKATRREMAENLKDVVWSPLMTLRGP